MDDGNLDRFQTILRRESRLRTGEPIPSRTPARAALVLETFFASANSAIRIVTGHLNARIYGRDPVIVEAKKFLADRSRTLEILFLSEVRSNIIEVHPLLAALHHNDNVALYQVPAQLDQPFPFHFAVVDNDAYRFKKDTSSHGSIVAFGDSEFAGKLLRVFSELRKHSLAIKIKTAELA